MLERKNTNLRYLYRMLVLCVWCVISMVQTVAAAEPIEVSYYYEEVCASCDGTKDFFELYNQVFSSEDKKTFEAKISTYNVFMDSCKEQYEDVKEELQIPAGTSLPVLVIDGQWISGHENMEKQMRDLLMNRQNGDVGSAETADITVEAEVMEEKSNHGFWTELYDMIDGAKNPVVVLFSTNHCEDCQSVKKWFSEQELSIQLVEYNIIENECLDELKSVFTQYQVPEEKQKVPAVFFGEEYLIGKDEIPSVGDYLEKDKAKNTTLLMMMREAETVREKNGASDRTSLWTLAAAGLLAGFNPCSISMLLMLMSLLLSEKASVWKNGLLYLIGKYAAYLSIGFVIFSTASQISDQTMEKVGSVMNLAMGILFAIASVLYIIDAVRVFRQDYGKIKMQLPVSLRRMNHNLIKRVSSAGGLMKPLMILALGVVISFGEFFCTGQIYMASITYMLKDQVKAAIFPFLVYTTAMSLPAVVMILLIQRTRNTEAVSDFMFRHLGAIKIFNAVLFALFAVYFLVF